MLGSCLLQVSPQQVPYNAAAMPVQMVKASLAAPGPAYLQQPALVPLVPLQGSAGPSLLLAPEWYRVLGPKLSRNLNEGGNVAILCKYACACAHKLNLVIRDCRWSAMTCKQYSPPCTGQL